MTTSNSNTTLVDYEAAALKVNQEPELATHPVGIGASAAIPVITRATFPTKNDLVADLNEQKFISLLSLIKHRIELANTQNLTFIKLYKNIDLINYNTAVITNITNFLIHNGYFINDIEDSENNNIGWKLSW